MKVIKIIFGTFAMIIFSLAYIFIEIMRETKL
jgi:cbb3-type cytochrome oxidase subunit 3